MRNLVFVMMCVIFYSTSFAESIILEDFQSFSAGDVPSKGWRARNGVAKSLYRIESEGEDRFLKATYTNKSIQFFKEKEWNIASYPWITWSWRVHEFPRGSDERLGEKNDSAAGFYVVFPGPWFVPRVIKYVWSLNVPVGTVVRRDERFPTIVIRTGEKNKGQWVQEKRNLLEDYKKLFVEDVKNPKAIGFLTDGNSVNAKPMADYDNIIVSSNNMAK